MISKVNFTSVQNFFSARAVAFVYLFDFPLLLHFFRPLQTCRSMKHESIVNLFRIRPVKATLRSNGLFPTLSYACVKTTLHCKTIDSAYRFIFMQIKLVLKQRHKVNRKLPIKSTFASRLQGCGTITTEHV